MDFTANSADHGLYTLLKDSLHHVSQWNGEWQRRESRVGPTLEWNSIAVVKNPNTQNYVSQCQIRKANPFFHLAEAMWMLAGRNDLDFLLTFNKTFGQFSDDDVHIRGSAYGKRWINWFVDEQGEIINQIDRVVSEIRASNTTRRAVVSQWDVTDLNRASRDVPCNLQTLFLLRDGKLDMTVYNRSNDLVYGMYGSNIVHFTIFHQLISALCDLPVGVYTQVSNCLHVYVENEVFSRLISSHTEEGLLDRSPQPVPTPLVASSSKEAHTLLREVSSFFADFDQARKHSGRYGALDCAVQNSIFTTDFGLMFKRMMQAFVDWKVHSTDNLILQPETSGFESAAKLMLERALS